MIVYVGTREGEVLALDGDIFDRLRPDQQVVWRFSPQGDDRLGGVFGPPAVGKDYVYVGFRGDKDGKGGRLYALKTDRESISEPVEVEWSKQIVGAIVGGPALAEEEGLVLVGSDDGDLYAFHAAGNTPGKMAWRFHTDSLVWSSPVVGDGVVYFGSMDNHVYAVSLEEGLSQADRLLWKFKTSGAMVATPLLLDDMVIVGSFDGKLYALKAVTSNPEGQMVWPQPFEGSGWFWAGAVSDGKTIFAATMDGTVYALDKKGFPIWAMPFKADTPIVSTPVVVGEEVVVATDGGRLHKLSAASGEERETFRDLGESVGGGDHQVKAPLTRHGSMLFVGVEDGTVRGVNVDRWVEVWCVDTEKGDCER